MSSVLCKILLDSISNTKYFIRKVFKKNLFRILTTINYMTANVAVIVSWCYQVDKSNHVFIKLCDGFNCVVINCNIQECIYDAYQLGFTNLL